MFETRFLQILTPFFICFLSLLPIVPMDKNLLPNQSLGTQLEHSIVNLFADNYVKIFINLNGIIKTLGKSRHVSLHSAFIFMLIPTSRNKNAANRGVLKCQNPIASFVKS